MDRRIVIYENNSQTGKGEAVFQFCQHVNEKNNILERDLAQFILQVEKSRNTPINAMLVAKFIVVTKKRFNPLMELIDFLFHREDFKPYVAPLPEHCHDKELQKNEVRQDLEAMRV